MAQDAQPDRDTGKDQPVDSDAILDLNFVPQWARKPPGEVNYDHHDGEDTQRRRGGGHSRDRRGGRRDDTRGRPNRGDGRRPPREHRDGPPRGDRGPRPPRDRRDGAPQPPPHAAEAPREQRHGPPRHDQRSAPARDNRRPPAERYAAPPEAIRREIESLPYKIRPVPEQRGVHGVARRVHHTRLAYPIMELASIFTSRPELTSIRIEIPRGEAGEPVYQCSVCGYVARDASAVLAHIANAHMDVFFDKEEVVVDAPSGTFVCVAKCGLSGELLGPPNHHSTAERIQQVHDARYPQMRLEDYKDRIETVRDEETIEAWKEQVRHQTVYRRKPEEIAAPPPQPSAASESTEAVPATTPAPDAEAGEATTEDTPAADSAATEAAEPSAEAEAAQAPAEAETPTTVDATPASDKTPASDAPTLTRAEAAGVLYRDIAPDKIKTVRRANVPVPVALQLDDPVLQYVVRSVWEKECRFPLTISFALRAAFKHMRLHVFKASGGVHFVAPVPPTPLDAAHAVDAIREVLVYLQDNPGATRQSLVEALRPGIDAASEAAHEVLKPLGWLVERGHIIEFFNGELSVPLAGKGSAPRSSGPPRHPRSRTTRS